jgi:hypothetical protein
MKKAGLLVLMMWVTVMTPSCLLSPDKEFVNDTVRVVVHDTVKKHDTTIVVKTNVIHDTIIKRDTVKVLTIKHDTLIVHDTNFVYKDTLFFHDTIVKNIYIHDTTIKYDTVFKNVFIHDTIVKHDTVPKNIFVHDTLIKHDTIPKNVYVHDTTIKRDTLRLHDTTKVHDTVVIHDTLRTFATTTLSSDVVGTWSGIVAGKSIVLTFTVPQYSYVFEYTANIGSNSYYGKVETFSNNTAHCIYMYGPGMIGETASWIISISNNVMTLQQTGYAMFPTMQAFTLSRVQ